MTKDTGQKRFRLWISNEFGAPLTIIQTNSAREMYRFLGYLIHNDWFKTCKSDMTFQDVKLDGKDWGTNLEKSEDIKKVRRHLDECYEQAHNRPMRKRDMRSLK